jgi:hypothetical protein
VLVHATTLTKHSVGTCWCRSLRRCLRHDDFYESHIAAIKRGQPLPFSHEKLDALCKMYSKRRVASQLGSRRCLICSAHTSYFSYIACARCCQDCFVTAPDAQLCSLEYAKVRHCSRTCIISTRALTWRSRCWCRMPIVHRVSRATLARYEQTDNLYATIRSFLCLLQHSFALDEQQAAELPQLEVKDAYEPVRDDRTGQVTTYAHARVHTW